MYSYSKIPDKETPPARQTTDRENTDRPIQVAGYHAPSAPNQTTYGQQPAGAGQMMYSQPPMYAQQPPMYGQQPPMYGQPPITPYCYPQNDDAFCNIYWVLFFFGLFLFCPLLICGTFGINSPVHNERIAGKANLIALCILTPLVLIAGIVSAIHEDEDEKYDSTY